jgi:organic hydroperoxide reductase OsmC/OhrA
MAKYGATVSWTSDGDFPSGRYSRGHEWRFDGGAVVRGSSSPHVVPAYSDPAGVDPEEALIASASACHMLWFLSLAQAAGLDVASYRDEAEGMMGKDDRGRVAVTRIILDPQIAFIGREPDPDELERLHHDAHERCFIANSLRTEIVVKSFRDGAA